MNDSYILTTLFYYKYRMPEVITIGSPITNMLVLCPLGSRYSKEVHSWLVAMVVPWLSEKHIPRELTLLVLGYLDNTRIAMRMLLKHKSLAVNKICFNNKRRTQEFVLDLVLECITGSSNSEDWAGQVTSANSSGFTALHYAAKNEFAEVAALLITNKADVGALTSEKTPALHCAADELCYDVVKVLLNAKADVAAKNVEGATALGKAILYAQCEADLTVAKMVIQLLLDAGASPDNPEEATYLAKNILLS